MNIDRLMVPDPGGPQTQDDLARAYWKHRPMKKWAVLRVRGYDSKLEHLGTIYVTASTRESAQACAKRNDPYPDTKRVRYVARLATPHDLGCKPTP